jgi:hypothetical protein
MTADFGDLCGDLCGDLYGVLTIPCQNDGLVHATLGIRPPADNGFGKAWIPRIAWTKAR